VNGVEDPYKALGVTRDASQEDIRRAYRTLAKQHHPDLNPGDAKAEERFKTVSAANELLSDPEKRGRFDRGEIDAAGQERAPKPSYRDYAEGDSGRRYGRSGPQPGGWSAEDIDDLFGSMFNAAQATGDTTGRRGRNEHYTLTTDFLDAVNGATRRLTLPDGRTLDVKIPPGTADGQVLRLRGQGGKGANGGTDGDALIEIRVNPHRHFVRDGSDIRLTLPITLAEAVLGGPIEVPTPGGPVRMRIPPHADSGTELRLRGRGVPAHGGQAAGDLYATLRVVIGTPDAALEEFVKAWKPEHPAEPRRAMEVGQ
jgi:DnaJ-class molecular chaperone